MIQLKSDHANKPLENSVIFRGLINIAYFLESFEKKRNILS